MPNKNIGVLYFLGCGSIIVLTETNSIQVMFQERK